MGDDAPAKAARRLPVWARAAIVVFALGLWTISVFEHEFGGQLFAALFDWGKATWGPGGALKVERGIFGAALIMAAVVFVLTVVKLARAPGGKPAAPELLARWGTWFLFAFAANRFTICLQSEDVHFAQYGFVAFCIGLATGEPRLAFVIATFMGFVDESNQWWRMYFHDYDNHLDWNDMILNACGASAGALPFTSLERIKLYASGKADEVQRGRWPFFGWAVVTGVAVITACLFVTDMGHYPEWPFWTELDNRKPFHVLTLREGLPALLGISYVLYYVVDERRRALPYRVLFGILLTIHIAVVPPRSDREQAIHEITVPPPVVIPRARAPITIDGDLTKPEWQHAPVLELHSFAPMAIEKQRTEKEEAKHFGPELPTRARVLWDDDFLYVGFECKTKDVWARSHKRDDPDIAEDSCVEVFLDTDAAERTYYEFEVTPGNSVQDLFVYWPQPPSWWVHWSQRFVNLNRWDAKGLKTAVKVQGGACDMLAANDNGRTARTLAPTEGYTVEMAISWADLRGHPFANDTGRPKKGTHFRANLYRVDVPRPRLQDSQLTYMSWSPTWVPLDFHRPQFFGLWELGD